MDSTEEKYEKDIWYVLNKLKDLNLRKSKNELVEYTIEVDDPRIAKDEINFNDEYNLIRKFIGEGIIEEMKPSEEIKSSVGDFILYPSYISYLKISDNKFENIYKKFFKKFNKIKGEEKIILPVCKKGGNAGYLSFNGTDKVLIGSEKTQQFRLLSYLMDPEFGVAKTVETVYSYITKNRKINNSDLSDSHLRKQAIIKTIKSTIKDLQKNNKLKNPKREIKFMFDKNETKVFLKYDMRK